MPTPPEHTNSHQLSPDRGQVSSPAQGGWAGKMEESESPTQTRPEGSYGPGGEAQRSFSPHAQHRTTALPQAPWVGGWGQLGRTESVLPGASPGLGSTPKTARPGGGQRHAGAAGSAGLGLAHWHTAAPLMLWGQGPQGPKSHKAAHKGPKVARSPRLRRRPAAKQTRSLGGKSCEVTSQRAWAQSRGEEWGYRSHCNGFIEI